MPNVDPEKTQRVKDLLVRANVFILNAMGRADSMSDHELTEINNALDNLIHTFRRIPVFGTSGQHYDPSVDRIIATGDLARMKALSLQVADYLRDPANAADFEAKLDYSRLVEEISRLERVL